MQRPSTAVNPLAENPPAAPAPVNPLAGAAAKSSSNYTVLASNDSGKVLFVQRADIKTAQDALQCGMSDLAAQLDGKPTLVKAYSDGQDNHQGIASFTGKFNGAPVKGSIFCGIGDKGAAITLAFCKETAAPADVAALINAIPTDAKISDTQLPYNLGTIGVAEGWKIAAVSQLGNIKITGPANQTLDLSDGLEVVTPNSMAAQANAQLTAQARMYGRPPPPHLLVAPFTGPADAITNFFPQLSDISQASGGPPVALDKINKTTATKALTPNGQSAYLDYNWTKGTGDSAIHFHNWGQYETYPLPGGQSWGVLFTSLEGPESTFARDLPLMLQMANSAKINQQAVQQNSQAAIAQQNQWFNNFEAQQKQKSDAFDSYMKSVQNQQLVRDRSNADFDEIINGYRDVEDTGTGDKTAVDLGNVDGVVNKLNEADPGRYKEIPLRDEMYPLPGNNGQ
jgi:hypothetical protein